MVYIRGNALDYDRWATEDESLAEWDYRHCLPYFIKAETREGGGDYRGDAGPLKVTRGRGDNPLCSAFTEVAQEAGYPLTSDMNGFQQEGFGRMDRTTGNGIRQSTAVAYLRPVMRRPNLSVLTRASANKLIQDGRQIPGVEFFYQRRN